MSLQIIAGPSGSGKSTYAYEQIIQLSMQQPDRQFIIVVPDQFSMSTTREILRLHPRHAIMNIDVLSFSRLTYRIADEVGRKPREILDDTGKNLILRRVALSMEDELVFLKGRMKRPGYIHEVKSQISEFYQYDISPDKLADMIEKSSGRGYLPQKLKDLKLLYEAFGDYIREKYITTEEALLELRDAIPKSSLMADSFVLFDNFTGFTPIQYCVIREMLKVCGQVSFVLCADGQLESGTDRLFELAQKTYEKLAALAGEEKVTVLPTHYLTDPNRCRYANHPPMAFLEKQLLRFFDQVYTKEQDAISIYEASSVREEVQRCCSRISELVRQGYEYRNIAIVTADTESYGQILREELTRYRIPHFMDTSRSVLQNPLSVLLRCVLGIVSDNYSYDSVMGMLSSRMTDFTLDEIDLFDRYLTRTGIRGASAYHAPFERGKEAQEAEKLRLLLIDLMQPFAQKPGTAKEYTLALYQFCQAVHAEEKCHAIAEQFEAQGEPSLAKEYEKIYPEIMKVLEQIYHLIGEDALSCKEFLEIFEAGIAEIRIGTIPQKVDQVVVGDILRTRLDAVDAIFFLGINEGNIPRKNAGGGLLSDIEREFLLESGIQLSPGPREKLYEQRVYLYQIMTKPSEKLYLSYAVLDASGKSLMPSYLIDHLKSLYPDLKVESDSGDITRIERIASTQDGLDDLATLLRLYAEGKQPDQLAADTARALRVLSTVYEDMREAADLKRQAFYRYEPKFLRQETSIALYEENSTISRLELMAGCPFSHFIRYGLGLKEKEQYRLEVTDQGSVYHKVMELLLSRLQKQGQKLEDLEPDELDEMIHTLLYEVIEQGEFWAFKATKRNEFQTTQMEQLLKRSASTMQYHFRKGRFYPAFYEYAFHDETTHHLRGVIDRIDLAKGDQNKLYLKVVDYKSGNTQLDASKLYYGVSLQLPVYLSRAEEMLRQRYPGYEIVKAAMLYYRLQNPLFSPEKKEDPEDRMKKEMICKGMFLEDDEVLALLDQEFEQTGSSDVVMAKRKADRTLTATSQSASKEEMQTCVDYAMQKADALQKKIKEGDVAIRPIRIGQTSGAFDSCQYCPYQAICGFDDRIEGYEKKMCRKVDLGDFTTAGE